MRVFLKVLAVFAAIGFGLTVIFILFVANFFQAVTDRDNVKQTLELEPLFMEVAPLMLAEGIRSEAVKRGEPPVVIDAASLRGAIEQLVPPGWVSTHQDIAVDALYDSLESGDISAAEVEIDLRPIFARVRAEQGREAFRIILESLPPCPDPQPNFYISAGNFHIPGCLPTNVTAEDAAERTHEAVVQMIDWVTYSLEEGGVVRVSLYGDAEDTPEGREQFELWHQGYTTWQGPWWLLWFIPLGCLLLILALKVRSFTELGHWWGWPFLITGIIALILAFLVPSSLTALGRSNAASSSNSEAVKMTAIHVTDALSDLVSKLWLGSVYGYAGVMVAIGGLLVAFGFIRRTTFTHSDKE